MKFGSTKYRIFCGLQFTSSLLSSISLCMSVYDLASHKGDPYNFLNYITIGCISTSIVLTSVKDSLLQNPKVFLTEEELAKYQSPV